MSYFDVIEENKEVAEVTAESFTALPEAEALYAGTESDLTGIAAMADVFEDGVKMADKLEESLELDKMGSEANDITVFGAMHSLADLEFGGESISLTKEEIAADPAAAVKAGAEAKETTINKIIRGAKDFIAAIIRTLKTTWQRLTAAFKTAGMNITKLNNLVQDLDSGDIKIDTEEEPALVKSLKATLGDAGDAGVLAAITATIDVSEKAYEEPTSKGITEVYDNLKKDAKDTDTTMNAAAVTAIAAENKYDVAGPKGSEFRRLEALAAEGKVVHVVPTTTKSAITFNCIVKSSDKKSKWSRKSYTIPMGKKVYKIDETVKVTDLKAASKALVKATNDYSPVEVIKAVDTRLADVQKDISEYAKGGKKDKVKKTMIYASFLSSISSKSTSSLIASQKTAYSAIKAIAQAAQ